MIRYLFGLAATAVLAGGCASGVAFKDVDLSFAQVGLPMTHVAANPRAATLVVYIDGDYDGGKKAFTMVLEDGSLVGQVTPRSYFIATVPAGEHQLVTAVPELAGYSPCMGATHRFEAGKIYIMKNLTPMPLEEAERALSLYSHLEIDSAAGAAHLGDESEFWKECIPRAKQLEVDNAKYLADNPGVFPTPPTAQSVALDHLDIPSPP